MTSDARDQLRKIGELLAAADRIGVISHMRPDQDAIGSSVALGQCLTLLGKDVAVINADPVPDLYRFLPGWELLRTPAQAGEPREVDVLVSLDSAERDRLGEEALAAFKSWKTLVNIDHHASNPLFGDINYVDSVSPATGQIIHELIQVMGWPMDDAVRDQLYAAISTDTGSFRYPNTTAETYRIGAALLDAGADVGALNQGLYESYPIRRIFLLKALLDELKLYAGGRAACWKLRRPVAVELGLEPSDNEGLIDILRAIDTVVVAVFFEELPEGKVRVSARSKRGEADVAKVCAEFGGGGHKLAAGARMPGPLDEAAEKFMNLVEETLNGLD